MLPERSRTALRPGHIALLPLLAAFAAGCSDAGRNALAPAGLDVAETGFAGEVIINDEEWIDRTVEDTPVDIASGEASDEGPSFSLQAAALSPEPVIRVGVVYAELNATSFRMGGRDNSDVFELRRGSRTGTLLASGLAGEVVATRVSTGPAGQIRYTLPGGVTITTGDPVVLVSSSGFVRLRRFLSDGSIYRGTAEGRFNAARTFIVGINELGIEQYLRGVVPRELGPIAYPLLEAQK
ncbi:MAG: SpoIID/LytB domain-containing protein, partial [Gemmatimonadetes bacterium]|nr:SpoIID/LytB domain-containing protein [Gemmatimonadota bacterium]